AAALAQESLHLSQGFYERKPGKQDPPVRAGALRAYAQSLRIAGLIEERRGNRQGADTLFERALAAIDKAGGGAIAGEIELSYADVLAARGAHEQASLHYRAAI